MADSSIVLNTNTSTGNSVDTRTNAAGEHRQVIVIGEGAAQSDAVVPADATNGLLTNPSDRATRDMGKIDIAAFDVALPSGTNLLGLVGLNSLGTIAVTISSSGSTVAASQYGTWNIASITNALPAGTNLLGSVNLNSLGTIATTVSSGTISLNSAGSLAITLASNGALAVVQPTAALLNATVTINSSGSTVAASQYGTWTVSNAPGTANIGAVSITSGNLISLNSTGSLTVAQATGSNLHVVNDTATNWIGTVALASGTSISLNSNGSLTVVQATATNLKTQAEAFQNGVAVTTGTPLAVNISSVASHVADSGNPIKVGGVYNSTLPALNSGDRGDIQVSSNATVVFTSMPIATGYGWTPAFHDGLLANSVVTVANRLAPIAIGGYYIYNPNTSVVFVQCFNTNGTVTVGTSVPKLSFGIPALAAANLAMGSCPIDFTLGLKIAATTTASNGTSPTSGLTTNWFYR